METDPPGGAARKDDSRLRHQGTLTAKERIALHASGTYLNPTATTDCRVRSFSTTATRTPRSRHLQLARGATRPIAPVEKSRGRTLSDRIRRQGTCRTRRCGGTFSYARLTPFPIAFPSAVPRTVGGASGVGKGAFFDELSTHRSGSPVREDSRAFPSVIEAGRAPSSHDLGEVLRRRGPCRDTGRRSIGQR